MTLVPFPLPFIGKALATIAGLLLLGGCATFSRDGGFGAVESITKERLNKEVRWIRSDADASGVQEVVEKLLASKGAQVNAFQMFVVGEGIEKKVEDYAAEVAAAAAAAQG